MAAKRRATERNPAPDRQPQAFSGMERRELNGSCAGQDQDTPSDYERELDRLDAAARAGR